MAYNKSKASKTASKESTQQAEQTEQAEKGKFDVYTMVTERIILQLEQGKIPWRKPWVNVGGKSVNLSSLAFNRVTKKPYSLCNQLLLTNSGEYATFKQWADCGGKVRKGEKSETVVFWKIFVNEELDKDTNKIVKKTIPMLRYYNVFHISQVDGVEPLKFDTETVKVDFTNDRIETAEQVFTEYTNRENIPVSFCGDEAFYSPLADSITIPKFEQFRVSNEYYSTCFHEAIHSTMHKTRCNREDAKGFFGSHNYSKEELVAEIGSSAIMNYLNIETADTFTNSTAYIQSWIKKLRDDKKFIVSASSKAEKAIKYILNVNDTDTEQE